MLETIRAFGLERLSAARDEDDARDRHAAFFRSFIDAFARWIGQTRLAKAA